MAFTNAKRKKLMSFLTQSDLNGNLHPTKSLMIESKLKSIWNSIEN